MQGHGERTSESSHDGERSGYSSDGSDHSSRSRQDGKRLLDELREGEKEKRQEVNTRNLLQNDGARLEDQIYKYFEEINGFKEYNDLIEKKDAIENKTKDRILYLFKSKYVEGNSLNDFEQKLTKHLDGFEHELKEYNQCVSEFNRKIEKWQPEIASFNGRVDIHNEALKDKSNNEVERIDFSPLPGLNLSLFDQWHAVERDIEEEQRQGVD